MRAEHTLVTRIIQCRRHAASAVVLRSLKVETIFYLNQQNPEKNEKSEIFASFNKKKVIFKAKKFLLPAKHV